jgi:hypothetical protein
MKSLGYTTCLFLLTYFSQASPVLLKALDGRGITATVTGLENGEVLITKQDGGNYKLPLTKLDKASKNVVSAEIAKIASNHKIRAAQRELHRNTTEAPAKEYTKAEIDGAYYSSRNFIKTALKAPATAEFSNPITDKETTGSTVTHEGRIQSKGFVDAQNSFGALLRQSWMVVVQPEGEQWRIVYAVLGKNILMDTRKDYKTENIRNAESFIGMTKKDMIAELGEPTETKTESNMGYGRFCIYSYSKENDKETFFTIWDSDGKISSGCYQGTYFNKSMGPIRED